MYTTRFCWLAALIRTPDHQQSGSTCALCAQSLERKPQPAGQGRDSGRSNPPAGTILEFRAVFAVFEFLAIGTDSNPRPSQSVRTEPKAQAMKDLRLACRARSEAGVPSCVSSLARSDSHPPAGTILEFRTVFAVFEFLAIGTDSNPRPLTIGFDLCAACT